MPQFIYGGVNGPVWIGSFWLFGKILDKTDQYKWSMNDTFVCFWETLAETSWIQGLKLYSICWPYNSVFPEVNCEEIRKRSLIFFPSSAALPKIPIKWPFPIMGFKIHISNIQKREDDQKRCILEGRKSERRNVTPNKLKCCIIALSTPILFARPNASIPATQKLLDIVSRTSAKQLAWDKRKADHLGGWVWEFRWTERSDIPILTLEWACLTLACESFAKADIIWTTMQKLTWIIWQNSVGLLLPFNNLDIIFAAKTFSSALLALIESGSLGF